MKRFITISLLSAMTLPILACVWCEPSNPYMFSMYERSNFKERVAKTCNDNWKAYLGTTEEWYYFHGDEALEAARQKGDALMVSYIENLQKYIECVSVEQRKHYEWDYPTPEEIASQKTSLRAIRSYALGKTKSKLRSQHSLLYMRCNMMLGHHQENISYWEQTASQLIETVYKDMMQNIYAGALYKTGQEDRAGEIFAEQGDYESLMTLYYEKRSYQAIYQHYKRNPNSKALPFLLQDFVNNTQEAADREEGEFGGKLFIRDISGTEAWQMEHFCELVVQEGKTEVPCMWKSAKAWLEYLLGKPKDAARDIIDATALAGTERMKDNARALMLYITSDQAKPGEKFESYLVDELEWLDKKQAEPGNDEFFDRVEYRLVHQVLFKRYKDQPNQMLALQKAAGTWGGIDIDTLAVADVEAYRNYVNSPGKTLLDKYLKGRYQENDTTLRELIGTKYMRLCQWDKAIEWLKDIPVNYYNNNRSRGYLYYSGRRSHEVEPWSRRQWLKEDEAWEANMKWWKPLKLDFCREMQQMEAGLRLLRGKALEQQCYNLAIRYAQANFKGDCWWLMRDSKSVNDEVRANEVDLGQKAVKLLQQAAMTSDPSLKRKALFALGYRELYNDDANLLWRTWQWDSEAGKYQTIYNATAPQYRAYQSLYELTGSSAQEEYIRRCDEYDQFCSYYRQNK